MEGSKDALANCDALQYLESSLFQPSAANIPLWELEALNSFGEMLLLWRPYVSYNNEHCYKASSASGQDDPNRAQ